MSRIFTRKFMTQPLTQTPPRSGTAYLRQLGSQRSKREMERLQQIQVQ